ncbi:carbohydrate ABC transporter membrane protein 1 (CUT1 family) [Haloactinopolyspora alba]|uniref:Carbohydrate ABC transporter membrane protein 1 (CUT1 family) n=1 Tax=Haloactinopolyspora alba TaxID=648780 RepID=A0A2P8E105_9ACTN|nr:sugar ABC transporter permease [Haloactinopolyspora alba]PSL03138.1 carbohydrate ABC transporter membrane protein 1 (CUT1 family) [Haloactinopolyspora alba]
MSDVRVAAPDVPERRRGTSPGRRGRRRWTPYLLLVPVLLVLAAALGYPLFRQAVMSFQEYGLAQQFGQPPRWIGLQNYRELVTDSYLWVVVARSIAFCLANAAVTMVVGTALAVLMTVIGRGPRLVLQIGLLLAWAMPHLASLTVWQWLFDSQYGVVNWVLVRLGLEGFAGHSWLIDQLSFFVVATIVVVWMSVPFVAFAVYAGLTQVPGELYEAAQIDGSTAWQRFRAVTVPLVRPVLLIVGLLQIIWDLKVFTQIFVLQDAGGITGDTNLIGTYIYRLGLGEGRFGLAAAASWFVLLITVALSLYYVRVLVREEDL